MFIQDGKIQYSKITKTIVVQASYLADMQDKHKVDDVIAGFTGLFPCNKGTPAVSHTERGYFIDGELWFFSSTSRPELGTSKENGTRWIRGRDLLRNPERWILQVKPLSKYTLQDEIARANSCVGMKYDFVGVVADFTLIVDLIKKKKTVYCSKVCRYLETGIWQRMSPRGCYKQANKNGYYRMGVYEVLALEEIFWNNR